MSSHLWSRARSELTPPPPHSDFLDLIKKAKDYYPDKCETMVEGNFHSVCNTLMTIDFDHYNINRALDTIEPPAVRESKAAVKKAREAAKAEALAKSPEQEKVAAREMAAEQAAEQPLEDMVAKLLLENPPSDSEDSEMEGDEPPAYSTRSTKVSGVSPAVVRETLGLASQRITVLTQALKTADIAVPTEFAAELDAAGDKIKALLKAAEK